MKKRDAKKDNVILFPGIEKRLLEKGLDYLKQKKYREAIEYLQEALEHDPDNSDIYVGLVLANYEAGNGVRAKELAAEMLRSGHGDYIQVIDLYLMILVQLNEYEEIVSTLEALFDEKEIPDDKYEHFVKMLEFGNRMLDSKTVPIAKDPLENEAEAEELNLFVYDDPKDQVMIAARLAKQNIRPYIGQIKEYLSSIEGHPFQKTMLLTILLEQEYNEEIEVVKLSWKEKLIPAQLPELKAYFESNEARSLLRSQLESEDPVLYENIAGLMERHSFLIYPFEMPFGDAKATSAAYHFMANEYFGFEEPLESFAALYQASREESSDVLAFIRMLEEISYPII